MRPLLRLLVASALAAAALLPTAGMRAQVRPVYDRGAAGLTQVLERLQTTASALHTGAHPDDEDSAFVARTARGDHARVAYLSLTRGEGGQNIIGVELFDALGVIRTEELLQARRLDGGEQFFTRAIDFGYSKTRAEAAAKWDEREVLDDMVRVIRTFRPLVIVSRFAGTEEDRHGHHQLAGYLTPLAFRAAGSEEQFTHHFAEGLQPWQARKLYRSIRRPADSGAPVVEIPTGVLHPVLGRTYEEIAAEGRSQHKSQEMGGIEPRGYAATHVRLLERVGADGPEPPPVNGDRRETSIFDGLDAGITGIATLAGLPAGAIAAELRSVATLAAQALAEYEPLAPATLVRRLAAGVAATRAARAALRGIEAPAAARTDADFLLARKEDEFTDALLRASGVVVDALAESETVPQDGTIAVDVRTFFPDGADARVVAAGVVTPRGWSVTSRPGPGDTVSGDTERSNAQHRFSVRVPADAPLTQPYFLAAERQGDRYTWTADAPPGLPFAPGPLTAWVALDVGGVPVTAAARVEYRYADRIRGEIRRNVNVTPPITVSVDSPLLIVPTGAAPSQHRLIVTATSHTARPQTATVRLTLPPGWTSAPAEETITLPGSGSRSTTAFRVTAPARRTPGRVEIAAGAATANIVHARDMQTIAYPHIETHRIYRRATATAQVLDLAVAPVRVGYVMGSGDQVPAALERMGVAVALLDSDTIARGDLSRFDTIVVGVRASEARPDFAAEHARLMDYVAGGGTLIVQYQQTDYVSGNLPPFPAAQRDTTNSRVTDEGAPVVILAPRHPVFNFPNRITAADFDGWVQERNLYAFPRVDARYTALLQTADPGEPPQQGGQVYAEIGKGRYVYTAYSWFRQLPAGVPGAYRQFANLISLSKAPR